MSSVGWSWTRPRSLINTFVMIKFTNLFKRLRKLFFAFSLSFAVFFSFAFANNFFEISKSLDIFATVFKQLHLHYVDDINSASLVKTAIEEMLESLDPYTNFISEDDIEDYRFMTTGQYGGIGALIQTRDNYTMISDPYFGFPAHKAGIVASDIILEINGKSVKGMSSFDVRNLLRGQPGTQIKLKIKRYNSTEPIEIDVVREDVKIENIPYFGVLQDDIGYIKLTGFTENAGKETKEAFKKLKEDKLVKKLILDLRGNGGGLLNEAVNIANIFLEKGLFIVSTKGKISERNTRHLTLNPVFDKDIPLVILLDRGSASASEIVAGAIQDYDRGVIVGQRSFGKGLVQNVVPLSYNSQLKVTVAKYYIPSDRCIQAINYAERNEDGSVNSVPDSLKTAFKTKAGRIVYDGGGIEPDIFVEPYKYSNISISLVTKYLIFDYATKFYFENKTIKPVKEFNVDDSIYKDFLAFIADKDYDYITHSERKLEELKKTAENEKYFDRIKEDYDNLRKNLIHNKEEDLKTFETEIKNILKDEIITRYYFQEGRIVSSLLYDEDILKAIEVLNDSERYQSILKPKKN